MATEERVDRRIQRTRQLLRDALMSLIVERGYESITLQDIADRANVSRTTFYLHYKDKDELLFKSMTAMYDELAQQTQVITRQNLAAALDEIVDATEFEHVAAFADFYRAILGPKGSAAFIDQVQSYLADFYQRELRNLLGEEQSSRLPPDLIAHYAAGAEIGVFRWWLNTNMQASPQEMAKMVSKLCWSGLRWALRMETMVNNMVE